jgi:hypothetical protein
MQMERLEQRRKAKQKQDKKASKRSKKKDSDGNSVASTSEEEAANHKQHSTGPRDGSDNDEDYISPASVDKLLDKASLKKHLWGDSKSPESNRKPAAQGIEKPGDKEEHSSDEQVPESNRKQVAKESEKPVDDDEDSSEAEGRRASCSRCFQACCIPSPQ